MLDLDDARKILRDTFGLTSFRRGQKPIIRRLLEGRSVLAVLPTGGGKSLCYQLPALIFDGLTLVVSPLIALMKDQVDKLVSLGVAAARLDSSLDVTTTRRVYDDLRGGRLKVLYVSPERLSSERFLRALKGTTIALMAVDEAHCISRWGHNFRPDYLKLARTAVRLDVGRVLALTATATPRVARDIARAFAIEDANVVTTSFYRSNLELRATPCAAEDRTRLLLKRVRDRPVGPGIVYVTRQKTAEEVAAELVAAGHNAVAYHAGIESAEREAIQDAFMKSGTMIVVATIAFGMGIDKADIRFVDHYNMPASLEAYAQEIGRAGRDRQPAACEMFASAEDVLALENFSHGDTPTLEALEGLVADLLGRGPGFAVSTYGLMFVHDIREVVVKTALTYLELEDVLTSTGSSYGEYRLRSELPMDVIAASLGADQADLLNRILEVAKRGRIWTTVNVAATCAALDLSGGTIASLLGDLEARGCVTVEPRAVLAGYQRSRKRQDPSALAKNLFARFERREAGDVKRIGRVVEFASREGCLTRALLSYFGEEMENDCGHCGPCLGIEPTPMPPAKPRKLGGTARRAVAELRDENHAALATPRQMTRFLCGLTSPATTKAKLTKDHRFGELAQ